MVNMTNCTDINMWFRSFKFLLSHDQFSSAKLIINKIWMTNCIVTVGAHDRIRTGDLFLTKEVLYLLSHVSVI